MAANITGQIIVTTAGTPVQGSNLPNLRSRGTPFLIKALPTNTKQGYIYGLDDDPFILSAGQTVPLILVNLSELYFDMETGGNGQGFCWIKV